MFASVGVLGTILGYLRQCGSLTKVKKMLLCLDNFAFAFSTPILEIVDWSRILFSKVYLKDKNGLSENFFCDKNFAKIPLGIQIVCKLTSEGVN